MIISIDIEKVFDEIQHLFMIKILNKLWIEDNFFSLMKAIFKTSTTSITFNR